MRAVVGLCALSLCVAFVYGEVCTTNDQCVSTTCGGGNVVICEHPVGDGVQPDGGLCTCAADTCTTREDCLAPNHPELNCEDARRHCYDNQCICSRWPGGVGK